MEVINMAIVTSSNTMITTFPFDDTNDLLNFLYFTSEIRNWEVEIAKISAQNGISMDLTTKKFNNKGRVTYSTFNNIKTIIKNFVDNNSYMAIDLDLRLRYPDNQRHIMDVNDSYSVFWLNCYSNTVTSTTYAAISFLENTKELTVEPITSWAVYIHSLVDNYNVNKSNNS